jgi:predicted Zn-dependent protease
LLLSRGLKVNTAKPLNWGIQFAIPTIVAFTCLLMPAHSANSYVEGCKSYTAGNYKAAEIFFKEAVATYPGNPLVHYQLANTEMGLHKRVEAKAEYTRCMQLHPDFSLASSCQKMLVYFSTSGASHSATKVAETPATSPAPNSAESEKEARKQEILRKSNAEASAIRAEAEKMISEGGVPGNQQLVRNRETGEVHIGVTTAQAEAMREEANARADKIQIAGKDRALHL